MAAAAGVSEDEAVSTATFAMLPRVLALNVFSRLPVDSRLRCAEVCPAWRDTLRAERSLWTRLDLSPGSGGLAQPATDALLRAAAARAGRQLHTLDVSDCALLSRPALLTVIQTNAGALRELRVAGCAANCARPGCEPLGGVARLQYLLRAAPALRVLEADLVCFEEDASEPLRNENGAFGPLRLRAVELYRQDVHARRAPLALMADVAAHAFPLTALSLYDITMSPAELGAVVDAVLRMPLQKFVLRGCRTGKAGAPSLARLAGGATLTELCLLNDFNMRDEAGAALLGDALRANSTLTSLTLENEWAMTAPAAALVRALTGHGSIRKLGLHFNISSSPTADEAAEQAALAAAFGALVEADAPALEELDVSHSEIDDARMGPIVVALPRNTHLRVLRICYSTSLDMSKAFVRQRLLPAVRANTSLRTLETALKFRAAREAEALVKARAHSG
jgi:hypothetical protein